MKIPTITEVLAMDDAGIAEFLGQPQQLDGFKKELKELSELKGKAKAEAERMWNERFTPSVNSDSLRWMKEDAIRHSRSPKEVLESTDVSSVF